MENSPIYFYDKNEFSYRKLLEDNTEIILNELLNVADIKAETNTFSDTWIAAHPTYVSGQFNVSWKTYEFLFFGIKKLKNIEKCPKTFEIIQQIPEIITAQFSILLPHTHVNAHKGYSTIILRNHLPLIVPAGNECGLRVENETHRWKKGELVIFDDSFEHEAWNNSNELRAVLMFDVAKPNCGYNAKEICRYKIERVDDPFLLNIAPKETWMKWHNQGHFNEDLK